MLLEYEKELIGFYASGHPLDKHKDTIRKTPHTNLGDIDKTMSDKAVNAIVRISEFKQIYRKSDKATMCRYVLEDLTGSLEVLCFTKPYSKYKNNINDTNIVILTGKVTTEQNGEITVLKIIA